MNDIILEANRLINGERQDQYGRPEDSFAAIAKVWTGLLANKLRPNVDISPADVALLMTGLKLARYTNRAGRDDVVDAHGYLMLLSRLAKYDG